MRYCRRFLAGIPHLWVDPHVFLTRPPLSCLRKSVRLACVRHAASVYPEPGSNSPFSFYLQSHCRDGMTEVKQIQSTKSNLALLLLQITHCCVSCDTKLTGTVCVLYMLYWCCFPASAEEGHLHSSSSAFHISIVQGALVRK